MSKSLLLLAFYLVLLYLFYLCSIMQLGIEARVWAFFPSCYPLFLQYVTVRSSFLGKGTIQYFTIIQLVPLSIGLSSSFLWPSGF